MIKVEELWIGDFLKLKSSGKVGKYEGLNHKGKLRIKVGHKIVLTTLKNVALAQDLEVIEQQEIPDIILELNDTKKSVPKKLEQSIDLHLEKLMPDNLGIPQVRILDYQIDKCEEFIELAISRKLFHIEIIHGKGDGTLKNAVYHLLNSFSEVTFKVPKNNDGAVEVWLKY